MTKMQRVRCLAAALAVVLGATLLHAAECRLSDWRISNDGAVSEWPGSMAAAASDDWTTETKWQLNREKRLVNKKGEVYAICEITADEDCEQGISVTPKCEVRLNGRMLEPIGAPEHFRLPLKQGKNVFELKFRRLGEKGRFQSLFLTLLDLDYVYVPVSGKIIAARRAITALGEKHPDWDAAAHLAELAALERRGASDDEVEAFRYRVLVLDNPEVDFDQVLFRLSGSAAMPANWQGNANYLRSKGEEFQPKFDDEVAVLDLKTKSIAPIYAPSEPRECALDLCLHYDADKFLYTGIDVDSNTLQIFEMNVDGTGNHRITKVLHDIDHYSAAYMPSGKLIFCSTASLQAVPCVGGKDYVGNLFEMNADGTGMRQITFDQENDWYPWIMENGRVMFCRWEYTDNAHYFTRILMQMNPDGTNLRSMYGSNSFWPNTIFYAKQIPGRPSMFTAICSGHHGVSRAGELIVFDTAKGEFEGDGAVQRIPGYGKKVEPVIIDQYMKDKWPRFLHPYPLSENYFLVSGQLNPSERWSLYLVDRFDNMIRLTDTSKYAFEPIPIRPRPTPPIIADRRNFAAEDSTLFIQDIYEGPGLEGVPRGDVKALRLFTYGYAYRLHGNHNALAVEGGWDTKRVLGTVPVEADGSVSVKVPHSVPISIQPLDEKGRAMQIMRSWIATMPGEQLSCVGCHESARETPPPRMVIASRKPPQRLTPWMGAERPYGFGFRREVQPVLDRYCVGCHDGSEEGRPNFADISPGAGGFGNSYHALHPYVRRPGPESNMHLLEPMEYHASTSELVQMLEKGHHGVKLDDEAWTRLITWIDLNVPYYATWLEERDYSEETKEQADRMLEMKRMYADLDDDVEWLPSTPIERPAFVAPVDVEVEGRPITLPGWPLSPEAVRSMASETRNLKIGGQTIAMARIPAGRFLMGSVTGAVDEGPLCVVAIEKPFWMSVDEITNGQFAAFDPSHDSEAIDQQWKDHIYPGYPANKPEMPVIRVSWKEAMAYCGWASDKTGLKVSLPTEAQWEWAARAGSNQPFYFGDSGFEKHANLADEMIGDLAVQGVDPQPIPIKNRNPTNDFVPRDASFNDGGLTPSGTGQYEANPWGLHDMHGNVSEWTRSDYAPYPYDANDGRNAGSLDVRKTVRGGSWRDRPHRATASYRLPYQPHQKVFNVGFRIVVED